MFEEGDQYPAGLAVRYTAAGIITCRRVLLQLEGLESIRLFMTRATHFARERLKQMEPQISQWQTLGRAIQLQKMQSEDRRDDSVIEQGQKTAGALKRSLTVLDSLYVLAPPEQQIEVRQIRALLLDVISHVYAVLVKMHEI